MSFTAPLPSRVSGMDAAPGAAAEVVLLDRDGVIVAVNAATGESFCQENSAGSPRCGVGVSFLATCAAAAGEGACPDVALAVRAALAADASTGHMPTAARITIPCHSADSRRWFDVLVSSRLDDAGRCLGATVALLPAPAQPTQLQPTQLQPTQLQPTRARPTRAAPIRPGPYRPGGDRLVLEMLDETSDAVVVIEPATGRRLYANRAVTTHTGYSDEELQHVPLAGPAAPEDRERIRAAIRAVVDGRVPEAAVDAHLLHRDLGRRAVELRIASRGDHVIIISRDVTERVRRAALAELAGRVTTLVLAGAPHEKLHEEIVAGAAAAFDAEAQILQASVADLMSAGDNDHVAVAVLSPDTEGHAILLTRPASAPPFTDVEREELRALANQKHSSVELGQARTDAARLALLDDRQRIARDLHDTVIQDLIATGMQLESLGRHESDPARAQAAAELVDQLDDAVRRLRMSVFELNRPPQNSPLAAVLPHLVTEAARVMEYPPELTVRGDLDNVPPRVADAVAAVLRECLSNVARHAGASRTSVRVLVEDGRLRLDVQDNGVGCNADPGDCDDGSSMHDVLAGNAISGRAGNGLRNLADRATELGGWMKVGAGTHRAGGTSGTRVRWQVPLPLPQPLPAPASPIA